MGNTSTEAQKKASLKYQQKTRAITVRITPELLEAFTKKCEERGESKSEVIHRLIKEYTR